MKKITVIIMILTIISKITGFSREIVLSYFYGASNISDAYLVSLTVPSVIFGFIGTGISISYIPMYSKIEGIHGIEEGHRYTNNLVNSLAVLCIVLVVFGFLYTEKLIKVLATGFRGETLALTVKFTKIGLIGMYFTGLISVFSGFLQLKENFIVPALIGLPMNFFIILSIVLSYKTNILILAIGSVMAVVAQLVLVLPFAYKKGYKYRPVLNIKDKHIKNMVCTALPIAIGVSVNHINILIDRTLASGIAEGGITALNYASRLNGFVQGLFITPIITVLYPTISKMVAEGNIKGVKKSVAESISAISLLVVPVTVGSMLFAIQIVSLLFNRGAFDSGAVRMTSGALFFYSAGMLGFGFVEVLSRAFYSMQDTKTPMISAVIGIIMNIILNLILPRYLGIGGLALATSISAMVTTILLLVNLRNKIGSFGIKDIAISFLKILFASLVMGLLSKLGFNYLAPTLGQNLSLVISVGTGILVYFIIIYFIRIKEIDVVVNILNGRRGRNFRCEGKGCIKNSP